MAIACNICLLRKGLKGYEIPSQPQTEEELIEHLEGYHHLPVQRKGETHQQCIARFLKEHPEARTCPDCIKAGAEWTKRRYKP